MLVRKARYRDLLMTDQASNPGALSSPYRSWIDAPADGLLPTPCGVIVGWCFRRDGRAVTAVRARVGERIFPGRYGRARPDVSSFFADEAGSAGSGFEIPVCVFSPTTCEIEAFASNGSWELVRTHDIVADSSLCSGIDEPGDTGVHSRRLILRGWCLRSGGAPVTAVRARIGRRVFKGLLGGERPDVIAHFGLDATTEARGFVIPVVAQRSPSPCEIAVQRDGSTWHVLRTQALDASAARPIADARKWARLWLRSWLGRPGSWEDVSSAEADYALAVVRRRGWFNLDVVPQYGPRAIAVECFPKPRLAAARLPRLVVVTPSYQQAPFIGQTMRSVLDQEGVQIEYVVQDGGSTDGSVAVIERYADRLAHWESTRDKGQADAIVRGFGKAGAGTDDIMMYLNSDDIMMPGAARFVAEYFARHAEVDAVYGHRVLIDPAGNEVGRWLTPRQRSDDLRLVDHVPQETLIWRRRIWDRVGGINPAFQFALDWDLLLRFQAAGARVARLPWFLGGFRIHPQQKTTARMDQDGLPEMNALRLRTLGRAPSFTELHRATRRAQDGSRESATRC